MRPAAHASVSIPCRPGTNNHVSFDFSTVLSGQVKDIDLSKESPCGHGVVTCFSIYGGDPNGNVCNFAADALGPKQDQLWVDTLLGGNEVRHCLCLS